MAVPSRGPGTGWPQASGPITNWLTARALHRAVETNDADSGQDERTGAGGSPEDQSRALPEMAMMDGASLAENVQEIPVLIPAPAPRAASRLSPRSAQSAPIACDQPHGPPESAARVPAEASCTEGEKISPEGDPAETRAPDSSGGLYWPSLAAPRWYRGALR